MSITFNCTACQKRLKAAEEMVGRRVTCSGCGTTQTVPGPPPAPATPDPAPAAERPPAPEPTRKKGGGVPRGLTIALGAVLILGLLGAGAFWIWMLQPAVWVGEVAETRVHSEGFTPQAEYSLGEGGKMWVLVYDEDQNSVGALVEDEGRRKEVEAQLKEAAEDVRTAAMKVHAGWILKGCRAMKVLDSGGHGIEAAHFQFSPKAVKVVVNEETIANQRFEPR